MNIFLYPREDVEKGVAEEGRPGIFNGHGSIHNFIDLSYLSFLPGTQTQTSPLLMAVPRQQSQRECSGRFSAPLGIFPVIFMSWMILMVDKDVNHIIIS